MLNRSVTVCAVVSVLLGCFGLVLVGAACCHFVTAEYAALGVALFGLGGIIDLRTGITRLSRQIEGLDEREANAFQLGRDSVRALR